MNEHVEPLSTTFSYTKSLPLSASPPPPAAPSHIVNEHVELAKRVMHKGSGGVANFVLR